MVRQSQKRHQILGTAVKAIGATKEQLYRLTRKFLPLYNFELLRHNKIPTQA